MSPQNATLMIVKSAARLHECASSDWAHLCDLIYVIGLGLPAVDAPTWKAAVGAPRRLAGQGRVGGIFLHAPAATKTPCKFVLSPLLIEAHPELRLALQHCAGQPNSKWKVVKDKGQPLAANDVRAASVRQLADAILNLRTLLVDGCRGYKV